MALPGMRLLNQTNTGDKPVIAAVEQVALCQAVCCAHSLDFQAVRDAGSPMALVLHTTRHLPEEMADSGVRKQSQNKKREVGVSENSTKEESKES